MRKFLIEDIPHQLRMDIDVFGQPSEVTCGPTALHALYRYYNDQIPLEQVIREVQTLEDGGTLAVWLGSHALLRGYDVTLYSYNLQLLDPTWFPNDPSVLIEKLQRQMQIKHDSSLTRTSMAFIDFLRYGGHLRLEEMTRDLLRKWLAKRIPILTGLSSTFLYRSAREVPPAQFYDDISGLPAGHFVLLCGYDRATKKVLIGDPLTTNPFSQTRRYEVHIDRVVCAILLGILTDDANFLIIHPKKRRTIRDARQEGYTSRLVKKMRRFLPSS